MSSLLAKGALAAASTLVAFAAAEVALRVAYPSLPSLAALEDTELQVGRFPSGCPLHGEMTGESVTHWVQHLATGELKPLRESRRDQRCFEPSYLEHGSLDRFRVDGAFRVAVAGDSVVAGVGAMENDGVVDQLERALATSLDRPVETLNLGFRGVGYCAVSAWATHALDQDLDALVVVYFGDDLEDRAMFTLDGSVVAFPDRIDDDLGRLLASTSYVANAIWFAEARRMGQGPRRFVDEAGREAFVETVQGVVDAAEGRGVPVLVALLPPAGMWDCDDDPEPMSRCDWIPQDLDLMADLLSNADLPFLDLRELWDGRGEMLWHTEARRLQPSDMVVHPSIEGHRHLALTLSDALLPLLGSP